MHHAFDMTSTIHNMRKMESKLFEIEKNEHETREWLLEYCYDMKMKRARSKWIEKFFGRKFMNSDLSEVECV